MNTANSNLNYTLFRQKICRYNIDLIKVPLRNSTNKLLLGIVDFFVNKTQFINFIKYTIGLGISGSLLNLVVRSSQSNNRINQNIFRNLLLVRISRLGRSTYTVLY